MARLHLVLVRDWPRLPLSPAAERSSIAFRDRDLPFIATEETYTTDELIALNAINDEQAPCLLATVIVANHYGQELELTQFRKKLRAALDCGSALFSKLATSSSDNCRTIRAGTPSIARTLWH